MYNYKEFDTRLTTSWIIGVVILFLIWWDKKVYDTPQKGDTISEVILSWSYKKPVIPFCFGVVMGHFFWPQRPVIYKEI